MTPVRITRGSITETYYVACRYFATEKWEFAESASGVASPVSFELLILLSGAGKIEAAGASAEYSGGQVWFLPSTLGEYQLRAKSPTGLLRTYIPDVSQFARRLKERGTTESEVSWLVYP